MPAPGEDIRLLTQQVTASQFGLSQMNETGQLIRFIGPAAKVRISAKSAAVAEFM